MDTQRAGLEARLQSYSVSGAREKVQLGGKLEARTFSGTSRAARGQKVHARDRAGRPMAAPARGLEEAPMAGIDVGGGEKSARRTQISI
jgi:hypothetical protein